MHFVSLQGPAGVELHYSEFVQRAVVRYPEWTQSWLNPKKDDSSFLAGRFINKPHAYHPWKISLGRQVTIET